MSRLGFGILYQLNVKDHAYQKNVKDHNRGEDSIVQNSSKRRVSMDPFRAQVGRVIDCLFPMMIYDSEISICFFQGWNRFGLVQFLTNFATKSVHSVWSFENQNWTKQVWFCFGLVQILTNFATNYWFISFGLAWFTWLI